MSDGTSSSRQKTPSMSFTGTLEITEFLRIATIADGLESTVAARDTVAPADVALLCQLVRQLAMQMEKSRS